MEKDILKILKENPQIRAVGFDMDGVLFETSKSEALSSIGARRCMSFIAQTRKTPSSEHFFDSLRVPELEKDTKDMHVYHNNIQLPTILTAWQRGDLTSEQVKEEIHAYYDSEDCMLSDIEVAVYKRVTKIMLEPDTLMQTRRVRSDGTKLLENLYQNGSKLLFGLSNWDTVSFDYLVKHFPDTFKKIHTIVVSADVRCVKPHPSIYQITLKRLHDIPGSENLQYNEILFIDDEHENCKGAEKLGMHVYHNNKV